MHAWQAACTTSESSGGRTMVGFGLCSNIARLKESVSGQGRLRPRLFGVELSIPGADGTYWLHHLTVHTWRSGLPFDRTATRGEVKYSSVTDEVRYFAGQRATRCRLRDRGSLPHAQQICPCTAKPGPHRPMEGKKKKLDSPDRAGRAVHFGPRPGAASDKDKHKSNPIQTGSPIVFFFC